MAKPRVFISSTFYDLKQIRSDLDNFIGSLGYEAVRNEEGDIPYGNSEALENYCYKEIKGVDILISIIGGRYGSNSKKESYSISQMELKTALKENKQIYIFIDKNVYSEYETYVVNKHIEEFQCRFADDKRIYTFIDEIKELNVNNNIKSFEMASDITKYLKEQFAGLFQSFLENQTRIREYDLIKNIENTSKTLNNLVELLKEENKDKDGEVNRILMTNHPLISELKKLLSISYNFYVEGVNDLDELLVSLGFSHKIDDVLVYIWRYESEYKKITLTIDNIIFDGETLKYIKNQEWKESYVQLEEEELVVSEDIIDDDDFPF